MNIKNSRFIESSIKYRMTSKIDLYDLVKRETLSSYFHKNLYTRSA